MNSSTIQLSAIIVCTNEKKFLEAALSSLSESLRDVSSEIIVVDNNSSDGSREFIKERFPNVVLVHNKENKGAAYARNRGIEKARGQYFLFLDCDTESIKLSAQKLISYLIDHPEIGVLAPRLVYPDRSLQYSCRPFPNLATFILRVLDGDFKLLWRKENFITDWDHSSLKEVDWTMSAAWLMPRTTIEKTGRFDEGYFYNYEDVDFCWRVKKAGLKVVYYPEAEVVHHYQRLSAKGGLRNPLKWSHLKSALRFFYKKTWS